MEALKRWRVDWRYPTSLICTYGFFITVKPIEPFLVAFMTGPDMNLTIEEVNNQIFPVSTYSNLIVLVPVFLLTDWLQYKPVVILQCANFFITTAMLLWTQGVAAMQAMQFFYGVAMASEVAYFSYIYSVIDLDKYRKATSYIRSFQLLGYTVGCVLGQLFVSTNLMTYDYILVFTLVLITIALVSSCLLPMPRHSMFFHRKHAGKGGTNEQVHGGINEIESSSRRSMESQDGRDETREESKISKDAGKGKEKTQDLKESVAAKGCGKILLQLWRDFLHCYSSRQLLSWSVWWAMANGGYYQTLNYVQVLWAHMEPSQDFSAYNGGVEAVASLLGAASAYGIGFTEVKWELWGELTLGVLSGLGAAALFLMTFIHNIWVCYAGYIVFKCLFSLLITIAMYQIAADLSMERYALVFGANNFVAFTLQTIMTSIVVDSGGLGLSIIPQFIIYASYFALIAIAFSLRGLFTIWGAHRSNKDCTPPDSNASPDVVEHRFSAIQDTRMDVVDHRPENCDLDPVSRAGEK
ncbi:thiamine transporter 2 [Genypterus blacodes]|uniref:thiamine transporter 2 n=1 Tax=Genypterus blacodes TaxID=154954 RepID=UPI003F75935A